MCKPDHSLAWIATPKIPLTLEVKGITGKLIFEIKDQEKGPSIYLIMKFLISIKSKEEKAERRFKASFGKEDYG